MKASTIMFMFMVMTLQLPKEVTPQSTHKTCSATVCDDGSKCWGCHTNCDGGFCNAFSSIDCCFISDCVCPDGTSCGGLSCSCSGGWGGMCHPSSIPPTRDPPTQEPPTCTRSSDTRCPTITCTDGRACSGYKAFATKNGCKALWTLPGAPPRHDCAFGDCVCGNGDRCGGHHSHCSCEETGCKAGH